MHRVVDLSHGDPDYSLLPRLQEQLSELNYQHRPYKSPQVHPLLAELVLSEFRKSNVVSERLVLVPGILDGMQRILLNLPGTGSVVVEDPGYPPVRKLLESLGRSVVPVPIDDEGLLPLQLAETLDRVRVSALIITPRAQNPYGSTITEKRGRELLPIIESLLDPNALVIEDDHAPIVSGVDLFSIGMAAGRPWVMFRGFGKEFGNDLRIAAATGDDATMGMLSRNIELGPGWVSYIQQYLALSLLSAPSSREKAAAAARAYADRRLALLSSAQAAGLAAHGRSGLNVWFEVGPDLSRLEASGWVVAGGDQFTSERLPGIRVTVSELSLHTIDSFVANLIDSLA